MCCAYADNVPVTNVKKTLVLNTIVTMPLGRRKLQIPAYRIFQMYISCLFNELVTSSNGVLATPASAIELTYRTMNVIVI